MSDFFHWPDHTIGKKESRHIREQHNATVNRLINERDELVKVCDKAADCLMCDLDNDNPCTAQDEDTWDTENDCNPCQMRRLLWEAIAKFQPELPAST